MTEKVYMSEELASMLDPSTLDDDPANDSDRDPLEERTGLRCQLIFDGEESDALHAVELYEEAPLAPRPGVERSVRLLMATPELRKTMKNRPTGFVLYADGIEIMRYSPSKPPLASVRVGQVTGCGYSWVVKLAFRERE